MILSLLCASALASPDPPAPAEQPNIVVILADDMGFSDLGCYGGEIRTPHIDSLAAGGLRYTQFYNAARCCPTRAALLTGLYPHQAGIGHMTSESAEQWEDEGWPGYRGTLAEGSATLAEVLGAAGYRTFMSGKWHVGTFEGSWPLDRGFERYYGLIRGASNFWRPSPDKLLMRGRTPIEPPEDFYATDAFTDAAIGFVEEAESDDDAPFFLYLAYTAPHWPLHAPAEDVARYRGKYRGGWDDLRTRRLALARELGVIDGDWELTGRDAPAWSELAEERQDELDHRMALYAAQVDRMDQGVGRLMATLERLGEWEDTLVLFLIDNGGCAEGGVGGFGPASQLGTREGYWLSYGRGWANASNTPFKRYKHWVHEGGIATPLVAHWPRGIAARGELRHTPAHLIDLMATFVELAGATYPEERAGSAVPPMEGVSLVPTFGEGALPERALFWEHEGNVAVRRGKWKLVATQGRPWELYDLQADRTETRDLAREEPELSVELAELWQVWADRCGVLPFPPRRRPGYHPPERAYPRTWVDLAADRDEEQ